ncbi:YigZ family protein [Aeromicrobium sp. IC_218]|uniref:IMPACT family protein n=1 Tax=Aeromicrobium sp. IC_218 TaxID=2545468 RepID=UPI00103EF046|nr:YigZ family protein [Aeromicrobium sp. IC_218]TCI99320.1 YigZ family protein [Aeromicrobium sp. IC_218]
MPAPTSYLTIAGPATVETEVKRSRFRCDVARVDDEDAARALVEDARRRSHDARHHCSAWVVGPDARVRRMDDDGEPSGTAGAPMLDVLTRRGLSDVAAVVTRWFGGTLLGAGGLVRAYGDAVGQALDAAGTRERHRRLLVAVEVAVADAGKVENLLRSAWQVTGVGYGTRATITVAVPPGDRDELGQRLASVTAGRARLDDAGESWVDA